MSLRQLRVWVATCDESGCEARHVSAEPADRWEAGRAINDGGWQAAPGSRQTFCPEHVGRDLDQDPDLASRYSNGFFRDPPAKR